MGKEGFWNDVENANKVNRRMKAISSKLDKYSHLMARCEDLETLIEMADEEDDESLVPEVQSEFASLEKDIEALKLEALLKGPYDSYNAVLSLHAGAGGTEAQDWVSLLYRMYTRYCEKMGYSVKVIDYLDGEEAGIKSVTFEVDGDNAYGYLKAEKGVHRLVRISPFDSSGRRHTSFASLDVTPIFDDDTNDVEIDMDDLRIDTYRSGGAGGQNVNKVSSAIRITHLPTGIVVQCQNERSQLQNKEMAMRILKGKLMELAEPGAHGPDERNKGRNEAHRMGQPDTFLCIPAVYACQGPPHRRRKWQHSGRYGWRHRELYKRLPCKILIKHAKKEPVKAPFGI